MYEESDKGGEFVLNINNFRTWMQPFYLLFTYLKTGSPEDKVYLCFSTKSVRFLSVVFLLCNLIAFVLFACTSLSGGSDWPSLHWVIKLLSVANKKDISLISEGKASFKADN